MCPAIVEIMPDARDRSDGQVIEGCCRAIMAAHQRHLFRKYELIASGFESRPENPVLQDFVGADSVRMISTDSISRLSAYIHIPAVVEILIRTLVAYQGN